MRRFGAPHPLFKPRVVQGRTREDLIEDVRHGRLDLAVSRTLSTDAPSGVEYIVVRQVAPDDPLREGFVLR